MSGTEREYSVFAILWVPMFVKRVRMSTAPPGTVSAGSTDISISRSGPLAPSTGVSEKSSTARPSSAPEALTSVHRMQKPLPLAMARPPIWLAMAVRLAASLPSFAPVPTVFGVLKSSASTSTQVPSVRPVASRLY